MAELLRGIEELRTKIKRLNASGTEIESGIDFFNISGFDEDLSLLDLPHDEFMIDGVPSNYEVVKNGVPIDLEIIHKGIINGDLKTVLNELGFSSEDFSSKIHDYIERYKDQWQKELGTQDISLVEYRTENGIRTDELIGSPIDSAQALQDALDTNKDLKDKFNKDIKKLREKFSKNSNITVGTWIKRGITLTVAGLTINEIWRMINEHKHLMNGCWMINITTGGKCKITTLSKCGSPDTKYACTARNHVCGETGTEDCFSTGKCLAKNQENVCVDNIQSCTHENCSKYCGSIDVPEGYRTHCVNINFWGAASDFFNNILTPSTSWIKIIIFIVIVMIVIAIFIAIIK